MRRHAFTISAFLLNFHLHLLVVFPQLFVRHPEPNGKGVPEINHSHFLEAAKIVPKSGLRNVGLETKLARESRSCQQRKVLATLQNQLLCFR